MCWCSIHYCVTQCNWNLNVFKTTILWDVRLRQCTSELVSYSFIPLACAECGDSLSFSGAFAILPYHILFPATLLRQLCFHPPSLRAAIYFLVYLLVLFFPNSYTILFWEFYFLPFSVRVQTNVIYVTLLSLLLWVF